MVEKYYKVRIPINERIPSWKESFTNGQIYRQADMFDEFIDTCAYHKAVLLVSDNKALYYVDEECCTLVPNFKEEISW